MSPSSSKMSLFRSRVNSMKRDLRKVSSSSAEKTAMNDAERELFSFDKPQTDMGMTDLLKKHSPGDRFLYAAIGHNQNEEESSRLRRLIQHKPILNKKEIPVKNLPILPLYDETEIYNLRDLLPPIKQNQIDKKGRQSKEFKTYINIAEVLIIYMPLISVDSAFSKVRVCIIDDRLLNNKVAKSYIASTNLVSKASMQLSYSFPRDEVDKISLTLSRETAFLEPGSQWGTAQIEISLSETRVPVHYSNINVQAINSIPKSMLEERIVNPDVLDISITENNRKDIREKYMSGDIADETEPIKEKISHVQYAKSSLNGPKGKRVEQATKEWSFMSDKRNNMPDDQRSYEPSEAGFDEEIVELPREPRRSAMKRPTVSFDDREMKVKDEDGFYNPLI